MTKENNCGNTHIDGLAKIGRMSAVWDQLEAMFPMVKEHAEEIWLARRDGRVRRTIEGDQRFSNIRKPEGPGPDKAEWELLAFAALEATGRHPVGSTELYRYDGLWSGMPEDHRYLLQRHATCDWCREKKGYAPCPTQGYPEAHVYVGEQ